MKIQKILFSLTLLIIILMGTNSDAGNVSSNCTYKGITLKGKVQVVKNFPDIKVQVVNHFPDIKVQKVSHFPDKCGKWQFVDHFPDFKIQYVQNFPDIKVKYVDHFPGVN